MPTLKEIRERCPDVSIRTTEAGKATCRFYADGNCVAAGHDGGECVIFPRQQALGVAAPVEPVAPDPAPATAPAAAAVDADVDIPPIEEPATPVAVAVDPAAAGLVRDPKRKVYAQTALDAERGGLDISDMTWSHSRLQAWQKCPRAFMYQYLMGLDQATRPKWALEGSAFHSALETLYNTSGESLMLPSTGLEESDAKLFGLLKALHDLGRISLAHEAGWFVERTVNFAMDGISWTTKMDLLSKDSKILVDHKTTGDDVDELGLLDVLYQMALYNTAIPSAEETWIDAFRKPALRRGAAEPIGTFQARVIKDVNKRPDYYHKVLRFYRPEINAAKYAAQMCEEVHRAVEAVQRGHFPRLRRHCSGAGSQCAYEALCIAEM